MLDSDLAARPSELPRAPESVVVRAERDWRRWAKRAAVLLVVGLVVLWMQDRLIGPLIHQQRQLHQASSFRTPKPTVTPGDAVAVVQVPTLNINQIVIEGATVDNLRGGPVHLEGSALPGDAGVMVLFGHRTSYGAPFREIGSLAANDEVVVQARNGPIVKYIVERVERGARLATVDIGDDPGALSYLLLVTNEGRWTDGDQVVVVARALPVTDAEPVLPNLGLGPNGSSPIGLQTLLAAAALVAVALTVGFLRGRARTGIIVMVTVPMVILAVIWQLMSLDALLPFAR
jgi:sortase A